MTDCQISSRGGQGPGQSTFGAWLPVCRKRPKVKHILHWEAVLTSLPFMLLLVEEKLERALQNAIVWTNTACSFTSPPDRRATHPTRARPQVTTGVANHSHRVAKVGSERGRSFPVPYISLQPKGGRALLGLLRGQTTCKGLSRISLTVALLLARWISIGAVHDSAGRVPQTSLRTQCSGCH